MKIIYLLSLLFLMSCGQEGMPWNPKVVKVQTVKDAESELYSYEFRGDSCTTGEQEFYTLDEACKGLLNEELNNNCSKEDRLELHDTNC